MSFSSSAGICIFLVHCWDTVASHANVLRGSSPVPTYVGEERLRDEPVRTSAWEARDTEVKWKLDIIGNVLVLACINKETLGLWVSAH